MRELIAEDTCGAQILRSYEETSWRHEQFITNLDGNDGSAEEPEPASLTDRQRDKISEIIAKRLLFFSSSPDHKLLPIITDKIVSLFPTETQVSSSLCIANCLQRTCLCIIQRTHDLRNTKKPLRNTKNRLCNTKEFFVTYKELLCNTEKFFVTYKVISLYYGCEKNSCIPYEESSL